MRLGKILLPRMVRRFLWRAFYRHRAQSQFIGAAWRNLLWEMQVARMVRRSETPLRALRGKSELKLHLGCGSDVRPGWVNLDLAPAHLEPTPNALFIAYDLRLDLPLRDNCCRLVYSSHFLEHLDLHHGVQMLRECHRVLRPGGVLRLCLPNFGALLKAYAAGDESYHELIAIREAMPEIEPQTETFVDHVNFAAHQNGEHKWIFDEEKIGLLLRHTGFSSVNSAAFDAAVDHPSPVRRRYSFYIEAVK